MFVMLVLSSGLLHVLVCGIPGTVSKVTETSPVQRVVNVVATHSRKCFDVRGAGLANGTAIQQWDCIGRQQTHQVFRLR